MVLMPPPIEPSQLTQCRRFEVPTLPAANSIRNFKSKSGTRIIELLVPLCFRSSCQSMLRRMTNFGNGALAADSQPLDQRLVATRVDTGEIIEQLAALRHELEQSTPGMVVLDVALEVLGQIVDAFRKNGHLHLWRSSVAGLGPIGLDDFRLACGRNRHRA